MIFLITYLILGVVLLIVGLRARDFDLSLVCSVLFAIFWGGPLGALAVMALVVLALMLVTSY